MNIKNSDFILVLDLTDFHGQKMRVADCASFKVRIWTNDPTHFLTFNKRDIISDDYNDRIAIDRIQMECLHSGTVVYDYDYSKWNHDFTATDEQYNKVKTVVTDVYWRNVINPHNPCNVVNYQTIEHIYDLMEKERLERESEFNKLKDSFNSDYLDKLNDEIRRSNNVDIEFYKLIKGNKEELDAKDTEIETKLDEEIKRSNSVDIEIFNLIKNNADADKETTDSITDKLNEEIARSTQKDADHENAINNEITRATNAETVISTKLDGEIERAKTAEGAIRDTVENERDRAIAKENLINDGLTSEISRAKAVESDITTSLQALKTTVQEEKQRSADKDTEHSNAINAETSRATAKENEIAANLQIESQRAQDREKHIDDDLHNEIDRAKAEEARIEALITSNADKDAEVKETIENEIKRATEKEKEIETTISNVDDNLTAEINRAVVKENDLEAAISDNADKIAAETNRAKGEEDAIKALITANADADATLQNDLTAEIARAKAEEARIENITSTNANNIASEIARSKQVEADITASLQQLKTTVQTKDNEHTTAINDLQTALQSEVSRSTTADNETNSKLDVINGDSNTIGSIAHSLSDSKHYTDDEISKLKTSVSGNLTNTLKDYATKAEVDSRIETIIGTAPEKLDTLGEIADVLNSNGDAIDAINGVLAGKANASDVYTKNDIDTKETAINNAISSEVSRATNAETAIETKVDTNTTAINAEVSRAKEAEKTISDNLATEVNRAKAKENELATSITDLQSALNAEVTRSTNADTSIANDLVTETNRAKAAEKSNADAIAIINGDADTIGSIAHGVADANHYTDDEIAKLKAEQNISLSNFATKNEVATVDGKLTAHISEADGKFATKSDVDDKLALKADTSMLDNYATKTSLQGVADMATANANAIDTINDTLPTKADKSDTYTKTEVDNLIDNVDVTEQLKEYPKKSETTVIKDESGNIITEMVIDNSDADDSVEVYTKEQCDQRFMKMWNGTQAQYDALAVKDNNTLYIIK